MIRRPPRSTLFPYTTLFRSKPIKPVHLDAGDTVRVTGQHQQWLRDRLPAFETQRDDRYITWAEGSTDRSEEHTSELQSRQYLVCRLLLEKKKEHKQLYFDKY